MCLEACWIYNCVLYWRTTSEHIGVVMPVLVLMLDTYKADVFMGEQALWVLGNLLADTDTARYIC